MATFKNLFHAAEALRQILVADTDMAIGSGNVIIGPLPETAISTETIYITLAWQQEHASHRNDGYQRNPDGSSTPPPVTLSVFYLITTYGETSGNAETAHRLLGEVIRTLHARPVLNLPAGLPVISALATPPEGEFTLMQLPLTPELMEKLFSLFQTKHRPFMVCEVGPVQLVSSLADRAPGPLVAPGGLQLVGPTPRGRPTIERVVPSTLAEGGWLRVDGSFDTSDPHFVVVVGGVPFTGSAIDVVEAGRSVAVQLPAGTSSPLPPGVYDVSVSNGSLASEHDQVQVVPAGTWSLDAPHSGALTLGSDVTLTGQNLSLVDQVFLWPDAGIRALTDVHGVDPAAVGATSLTFPLPALPPGTYRLAARVLPASSPAAQYTPYVVVEVRA